jgi:6-phosphogluconate dehydrogenase
MATGIEFGVIGLGRMGGGLALQALERGMRVVGLDPHPPREEMVKAGMTSVRTLAEVRQALTPPRIVFLYVPAGPLVDDLLDQLAGELEPGDIIVDGGNSYWGDSIRRAARLRNQGLRFCDAGTSGGVEGARHGACFMVGGEDEVIARLEPIFRALAVEGGYVHAGPVGAGHFAKLVHNGIEFGMLQAIGEGVALLEAFHDRIHIAEVLRCWRYGSVIRGWLMDLMDEAYRSRPNIEEVPPYVDDTGEVNWLVGDALDLGVSVPVIVEAVMQLLASRDGKHFAARAVAMMRHGFGNHPFGPNAAVARERREGRVGDLFRET